MGWLMVICCEYETILRKNIRKMCTRAFHYQYCCCFAFNQALLVKISFYLIIYSLLMTMMMVPGVWWWFVFDFRKFNWFWQTTSLQIKIVYKYTRIHRCIFSAISSFLFCTPNLYVSSGLKIRILKQRKFRGKLK